MSAVRFMRAVLHPYLARALVVATSLVVYGCASDGQEDLRSITYVYSPASHLAAERRVSQEMQDACFFSGAQYYETVGRPQLASQGEGRPVTATLSFYCVGTQSGP